MTGLEATAISLGAVVVKSASKIWIGDSEFASGVTSTLVDALAGRVNSVFDQRRISRFFDDCADVVAKRLAALMEAEFRAVPANERGAALLAVRDTFERTALTDAALFRADLDARLVERQLLPAATLVLSQVWLSQDGEEVFRLVLRESCAYLVEVVTTLPKFQAGALTELLRRETSILSTLTEVLNRLPERRGMDDFAADYGRVVANKLDRMELMGVTLADANRRYPLSVSYIDLSVTRRGQGPKLVRDSMIATARPGPTIARAESALADVQRALIIGTAGSGKTTLLRWLAVRSARRDFSGPLAALNGTVPFFIPLRRYVGGELPGPQDFPLYVGAHIAHEMPRGWVHQLLRSGQALVLVDGVDEVPADERGQVRAWLTDLQEAFLAARFVVSSRPSAIEAGWLDQLGYTTAELQPMSMSDVALFIRQWHVAIGSELLDAEEQASLAEQERSLLVAIDTDRRLRALAVSPLLCALVCALNRERRNQLPSDRMEIYSAALEMLLGRRDAERKVAVSEAPLTRSHQVQLLQDIAFWFIRNGLSDAPTERVTRQIERTSLQLGITGISPEVILQTLLERSGLIREPAAGRIDFVHRTFQEFLAGKAAAENDEIGLLVRNAHDAQWREVVVMAAAQAQPEQCAELLSGLLRRGRRRRRRVGLWPLAIAAAQAAPRIPPQLRAEVARATAAMVPPDTSEAADALVGVGDELIALLRARPPRTEAEALASIRAISAIGGRAALAMISEILQNRPADWQLEALVNNAWRFFKPDEYLTDILVPFWPPDHEIYVSEPVFLSVLSRFDGLRRVRCQLGELGLAGDDISPLARNRQLHSVALEGCSPSLNLSPLRQLPLLEQVSLACNSSPPLINPLSELGLTALTLRCPEAGDSLRLLGDFSMLRDLELSGCHDVSDIGCLWLPASIQNLRLAGFGRLSNLSGARHWDRIKSLELVECPALSDLGPIAKMASLEALGLGTVRTGGTSLAPLVNLPRLREVVLMGDKAFDLSGLRGRQAELKIHVPLGAKLMGREGLAPGVTVTEFTDPPRVRVPHRERDGA
jgi:NACHT N-terminal Helical domain 1/NACHT domain